MVIALVAVVAGGVPQAGAIGSNVVISQVYGGGGNSGATLKNDFIELYNPGAAPVDLTGWSVQYAATIGTNWSRTALSGSIPAGGYYLVQEAQGAGGTINLPTPDATGTIAMAAGAGKVVLLNNNTTITPGTVCPSSAVDLVGYGAGTNCSETLPTGTLSNSTAALRNGSGAVDTDNNSADFTVGTPNPRNTGRPAVSSTNPANAATDVAVNSNITITFSESVNVTGEWFGILCGPNETHTALVSGGPATYTLDPDTDFGAGKTCAVTVKASEVADLDGNNMASNYTFTFTTISAPTPPTPIHDIQGAAHISPKNGQNVSNVQGIVTGKRTNGFYMQDPSPDSDPATSEGIFVFTSSAPGSVNVGDLVRVSGSVSEFRPGGSSSANLTTTELSGSPAVTVLSSGNALPAPTVVGTGGRIPPSETIEDDASGDVETGGAFDPAQDGLDFWESMEGMRVQLNDAVAVGPTNAFGETPVVGDNGANAGVRTARGGLVIRPNDFNPERLILDDIIVAPLPTANVGDHYTGSVGGVLDYNFGNFMLELTAMPTVVHDGVTPETTTAPGASEVTLGTFNFENLDPTDPPEKFARLAGILVNNLKAPYIVSGEEVQDNNGPTDNGVVDANVTLDTLVSAIEAAGGPHYDYRYINPVNDQDGGEPGGNIRQVFLFRPDQVSFVDRPGGGSTTPTTVVNTPGGPQLSASPGRIDPTNSAFNTSRKPLAGEFMFKGHHLFVIANHFNSKGGDQPLMGHFQPPTRSSEAQRHNQAQVVHDFVASILAADANANVVVDGDLNDFEFSETVTTLKTGVLEDLIDTLPQNERYSYVFEGNSQTLDHILMSGALFNKPFVYDVVHVNSEFADQASDHEPSVVRVALNAPPTVNAGGPYTVDEGGSLNVAATGADPEGGPLDYAWDLDNNGTFETPGQSATFSAAGIDGPATRTIRVRATDDGGLSAVDDATVTIRNVAPTVTAPAAQSASEGTPASVALGFFTDAGGSLDAPSTVGVSWGDGSAGATTTASAPGSLGSITHTYDDNGTYHVTVTVTDKDGAADDASFDVTVANVAPTATFNAPASTFAGFPFMLSLSSPHDPSAADTAAGFMYAFDCGSGYGPFGPLSSASCPTTDTGTRAVGGKIRDKDGDATEYRATVQVVVTFASLCDLARSYSTDPKVADELCDKLANAEVAPTPTAREGLLTAFRNQVDAKTGTEPGKAFTAAQADLLKLLSTRL